MYMQGEPSVISRQIGSPAEGFGAGFKAALIAARPGLAMGVGGKPA